MPDDPQIRAVFEIRKTKTRTHGRIEVQDYALCRAYLLQYYVGDTPAGTLPVQKHHRGRDLLAVAIGLAARAAPKFAAAQNCRWVYRKDSAKPLRPVPGKKKPWKPLAKH